MKRFLKSLMILGACYVILAPILLYIEAVHFQANVTTLFWALSGLVIFFYTYSLLGFYVFDKISQRKKSLLTSFHLANILIRFVASLMIVAIYYLIVGKADIVLFIVNLMVLYIVTMLVTNVLYYKAEK